MGCRTLLASAALALAAALASMALLLQPWPPAFPGSLRAEPLWELQMTPVADTWIEVTARAVTGARPNSTPQGAATALHAGWSDVGLDQRTVMRFVVPTPIPDTVLQRAELELDILHAGVYPIGPPLILSGTLQLRLHEVTMPWDEATLTGLDGLESGWLAVSAEVPWGPCNADGCGKARVDVLPLVKAWQQAPFGRQHGLVLDASQVITDRPVFGAHMATASRESDRPPLLRLEHAPSLEFHPDLRGSAYFDCARGGAVLGVENGGSSGAGRFAVRSSSGGRWEIPGLASGARETIFDSGTTLRSYEIDPDDAVRESDEGNNTVLLAVPECPTPSPEPRDPTAYLPLVAGGGAGN